MSKLTKKELAEKMGKSLSSVYYRHKREELDLEVKNQIETVLTSNPAYGHKRIALSLKLNKKRILRVMKKYNLKPLRRQRKHVKRKDLNKKSSGYENLIEDMEVLSPEQVWASDFTYIKYKGRFIYLATVIDLYTREIVGVNISRFHNKELVLGALEDALKCHAIPEIIHSDQGSEYDSQVYIEFIKKLGIQISMSRKGSPWENSYQESFYGHFKEEFGDFTRFEEITELVEEIYMQIWYHNNERIHTALKMSPVSFKESYSK
jgi:putative transposase